MNSVWMMKPGSGAGMLTDILSTTVAFDSERSLFFSLNASRLLHFGCIVVAEREREGGTHSLALLHSLPVSQSVLTDKFWLHCRYRERYSSLSLSAIRCIYLSSSL